MKKNMIVTTVEHLIDVEVAIINYMFESVESCNRVLNEIDTDYFTFIPNRVIFSFLKRFMKNNIVSNSELMFMKNNYEFFFQDDDDLVKVLHIKTIEYIFTQKGTDNIDADIFEIKEYYLLKSDVLMSENINGYNIKNDFEELLLIYYDDLLCAINSSDIKNISKNIFISYELTTKKFI